MWSHHLLRRRSPSPFRSNNRDRNRPDRAGHQPRLEVLEERQLLSGTESFQFGASYTPVVSGYTLVPATPYSASAGYGWQGPGAIVANSSATSNPPLEAGYNAGYDNTFLVNLPNGTYNVTPTLGTYLAVMDKVSLTLDGQQVASNLSTAAGQFTSPTYQTTVSNGQLSLLLVDGGGATPLFWIDALTISPVTATPIPTPTPTAGADPAFQFGASYTPVVPGYALVPATPYSASAGYGWQGPGAIYANNSGTSNPAPLEAGYNEGYDNTFLVNLPNGTYNVTPTMGTYLAVMDKVSLTLDGQQVASGLSTAAGQFTSPTYQTTVSNGQLSLLLVHGGGVTQTFWIDALTIAPVTGTPTPTPTPPPANGPTASAGPAITANEGSTVSFSGATAGGGTAPLSYLWNFGDGTSETGVLNPTHVYQLNGSYTATLTVTDANKLTATSTAAVTINQVAPVALLQAPSTGTAGSPVSFSALATDTNPLDQAGGYTYAWNFGDGTTGTGASPTHTYNAAGTFTVSVTATAVHDGAVSKAATATLQVTATSGPINITSAWLAQQGTGPYYLTQSGATYVLQTDVSVPGTAFIALAPNITFNLNGYTVTYDTAAPITVTNGGFEQGTSPTDIPGWNVSQAPGAVRVAAPTGMWGSWALELPNISSTETISSSAIAIPQANAQYAALITPNGPGQWSADGHTLGGRHRDRCRPGLGGQRERGQRLLGVGRVHTDDH